MHETLLARAAKPAPVVVLGLLMRPFSIGHQLLLQRESNPLAESNQAPPVKLIEAALFCSQTWRENEKMPFDPFINFKMFLWGLRLRPRLRKFLALEMASFTAYRDAGSLEFPISDRPRPDSGASEPRRPPGTPFLLRLQQFLMVTFHLSEAQAWDYPFGLAKMRWLCHWEEQDGIDVYNHHDAEFDRYVAEQEAKGKEQINA